MLNFESKLLSNNTFGLPSDQLSQLEKALTDIREKVLNAASEEQIKLYLQNHQKICLALASELPSESSQYNALLFWLESLFLQYLNAHLPASSHRLAQFASNWEHQFRKLKKTLRTHSLKSFTVSWSHFWN